MKMSMLRVLALTPLLVCTAQTVSARTTSAAQQTAHLPPLRTVIEFVTDAALISLAEAGKLDDTAHRARDDRQKFAGSIPAEITDKPDEKPLRVASEQAQSMEKLKREAEQLKRDMEVRGRRIEKRSKEIEERQDRIDELNKNICDINIKIAKLTCAPRYCEMTESAGEVLFLSEVGRGWHHKDGNLADESIWPKTDCHKEWTARSQSRSQTSRSPIEIEKYNFGHLMEALYEGDIGSIPDDQKTRSIVGSILRGIGEVCELTPIDVVGRLPEYISPHARVMARDPGRGIADVLVDLARARDSPNMMEGMTEFIEKRASFSVEGLRDGRVFVANHQCVSLEYDRVTSSIYRIVRERASSEPTSYDEIEFTRLMTPSFRERSGFADPTEALRKKKLELAVAGAERACRDAFPDGTFCGCSVERISQSDLDDAEWTSIGADFRSITRVPRMRSVLSACY